MLRKFVALAAVSLALAGWAAAEHRHASVKIMTQNMDDGTDQTYVIAALTGQIPIPLASAVDLTFAELQASNFAGRAKLLAGRIAQEKPDLVALQEAALWRFQPNAGPEVVLYNNVDLLLSALTAAGVPYQVIPGAVNELSDLALPGDQIGGALRFTDRNAVLVRSDLHGPKFSLSNVQSHTFDAKFLFPVSPDLTLEIPAGWISADVHIGDELFRLVTTHLESPIAGIPTATDVQVAQAEELILALGNSPIPVVICGDFNSDANHGGGVEDTPAVDLFPAAGYTEAWPATHRRGDLGFTWPLFLEDQFPHGGLPPPFFAHSRPFERIDLFFSKGIDIVSSDRVLAPARGSLKPSFPEAPPFGSDHAGVIAVFRP